jgi:hypothetical protein
MHIPFIVPAGIGVPVDVKVVHIEWLFAKCSIEHCAAGVFPNAEHLRFMLVTPKSEHFPAWCAEQRMAFPAPP